MVWILNPPGIQTSRKLPDQGPAVGDGVSKGKALHFRGVTGIRAGGVCVCVHTHVRITTQPHSGQQSTETICHHLHSAKVQTVKCIFCQYGFYTLESGFCKQEKKKVQYLFLNFY